MARKRSHGEGSVWKLKNGMWRGQLMDGYTDGGKKNIISFSGETRGEVLEKLRDYQNKKDAHIHVDKKLTLSNWADLWYCDYKSQVQAATYSGYQYTLKIIKEQMGTQTLCDVLPIDINRFMDFLVASNYSLSQIRKCRTMLIQIFDAADANGLVAGNPARKAKIIRDKDGTLSEPRYEKDAFDDEEVELLKKNLPHNLTGYSIRVMLDSGLRVQELLALSPSDISEDGSEIRVCHAIKTVDNHPVLGPPKSKSGLSPGVRRKGSHLEPSRPQSLLQCGSVPAAVLYRHRTGGGCTKAHPPLLPPHLCHPAAGQGRAAGIDRPSGRSQQHRHHQ